MGVNMSLQASKKRLVVGSRAGLAAKDFMGCTAVEPADLIVCLQARRQHGLHLLRFNSGRLAHLAEHPLEAEIDEHFAKIEVDEFGCHGSLNRRGKQSFFTHPG